MNFPPSIRALIGSSLALWTCAVFAAAEVDTVQDVALVLSDAKGQTASVYQMSHNAKLTTAILFRPSISKVHEVFSEWAIEITDPSRNLVYRASHKTKMPKLIRWDGVFPDAVGPQTIKPGGRYFMRLLLIQSETKQTSSPWSFFSTQLNEQEGAPRISEDYLSLFVVPSGTLFYTVLTTPRFRSIQFPSLAGDLRVIWKDRHTFGLRLEATTNVLFNYTVNGSGFFYSDFSFFYNYFFVGTALRRPVLPLRPSYAPPSSRPYAPTPDAWGKKLNVEGGMRFFFSVLRGFGNQPIDSDLARGYQGVALTLHADRALGWFRARGGVEAGYSVFRGSLLQGSAEGSISYERFEEVAPAITLKYQFVRGSPHADPYDGNFFVDAPSINNQFLMAGLTFYFKI